MLLSQTTADNIKLLKIIFVCGNGDNETGMCRLFYDQLVVKYLSDFCYCVHPPYHVDDDE